MKHLRLLWLSLAALTAMSMYALDLPIKKVNGRPYYYYEVKAKDDLYTICRQLGVTRTEIVRNNPSVADGLRRGQTLYFPVEESDRAEAMGSETVHLVKKGETLYGIANLYGVGEDEILSLNPGARGVLKAGVALVIPSGAVADTAEATAPQSQPTPEVTPDLTPEPQLPAPAMVAVTAPVAVAADRAEYTDSDDSAAATDTLRVTLMLPFMLDDEQPSKSAQLYTEFFKGFMLAVDSLRDYGAPLVVTALDTRNLLEWVESIVKHPQVAGSDLIVGPDNEAQLNAIAAVALDHGISVLNVFTTKGNLYQTNPVLLQANIPRANMYAKAAEALMDEFATATPVFLQPTNGDSDKAEFHRVLREALDREGRQYVKLTYANTMHIDDLAQLDRNKSYLFIPSSGKVTEFNRIYPALRAYKDQLDDMSLCHLFGYPEWITFRSDGQEKLHYMNATIYSRFYNDAQSGRSSQLNHTYVDRYGTPMLNAIPVQGILGFDTGMYVIRALNDNLKSTASEFETAYDGIQNDYHFVKPDGIAGRINNSLYLITFRPSGYVDKRPCQ